LEIINVGIGLLLQTFLYIQNSYKLGQDVLRNSNPDRIMMLSRPPGNRKWDPVWTSRHCQREKLHILWPLVEWNYSFSGSCKH